MDILDKVAYFALDLLVPLMIGYFSRRQEKFDESFFKSMMTVNIQVINPILALLGFWTMRLSMDLAWLPICGIVANVIPGAIALYWAPTKYKSKLDQGSYIIAATLPNNLVLGGITAFILFGETGFTYTQLITLLSAAFAFTVCFPTAQYFARGERDDSKVSLASILFSRNQLSMLGLLIGGVLMYFGVERPAWAGALFDPLVHAGAWTALIPVGRSVEFGEMRRYWRGTLDLLPIKYIAAPALTYLVSMLVVNDPLALKTLLITTGTPTGIFAVVTVKLHELNLHITMAAFIITTVIYLLLVFPLQFLFMAV